MGERVPLGVHAGDGARKSAEERQYEAVDVRCARWQHDDEPRHRHEAWRRRCRSDGVLLARRGAREPAVSRESQRIFMTDESENVLLAYLRRLDAKVDR